MELLTCKMCGGNLDILPNMSVGECQYCGRKQTLPQINNNEKIIKLYNRANYFRQNNEYDKAMGIYETILSENDKDAEAYWSLVLCQYGIQYVDDPNTNQKIPTVNRAQYTPVSMDGNYLLAMQHADEIQKELYYQEAQTIDNIQKGIIDISSKETPFDIFICYKETDERGMRTKDSVYAQELYDALTKEGYKVFFSRITLEDKLGTAYEPYIFAALNSSKVMLAVGTKPEHFNAVWVKNEWSRYLALIKSGENKTLVPVYCEMSPYDLPSEFAYLQAQDMSVMGFKQDLVRNIKKLISPTEIQSSKPARKVNLVPPSVNEGNKLLEQEKFDEAFGKFKVAATNEPYCWQAYWGMFKASIGSRNDESIYFPGFLEQLDSKNPPEYIEYYKTAKEYAIAQQTKQINFKMIELEFKKADDILDEYDYRISEIAEEYESGNPEKIRSAKGKEQALAYKKICESFAKCKKKNTFPFFSIKGFIVILVNAFFLFQILYENGLADGGYLIESELLTWAIIFGIPLINAIIDFFVFSSFLVGILSAAGGLGITISVLVTEFIKPENINIIITLSFAALIIAGGLLVLLIIRYIRSFSAIKKVSAKKEQIANGLIAQYIEDVEEMLNSDPRVAAYNLNAVIEEIETPSLEAYDPYPDSDEQVSEEMQNEITRI